MFKKIGILTFVFFASLSMYSQTTLPDISLKNLDGDMISIKDISKGKTVVIDFWYTSCVNCIEELDAIAEVYEELQEEIGFELITVTTDNSRTVAKVKPFVNEHEWEYEVLYDTNKELYRALNVPVSPYVLIVKDGKILYTHQGYSTGAEEELFKKFEELKD